MRSTALHTIRRRQFWAVIKVESVIIAAVIVLAIHFLNR